MYTPVIGLHTYQTENHPEEHSEQSITNNIPVVQDLVGERVANRHSVHTTRNIPKNDGPKWKLLN